MSKTYTITGKTIDGNFQGTPRTSCSKADYATDERITVTIDGIDYERTIFNRVIWRNQGEQTLVAQFVIVNGIQYEVAPIELDEEGYETEASIRHRIAETFGYDEASIRLQEGSHHGPACDACTFTVNGRGLSTDFQTVELAPAFDC